jgi:predicted permease
VCRKIPGLNAPAVGALILAAAWPNVTYLGLPVVSNVVGEHVQRIPILYDLLGVTPLLFTLGVVICVEFGSRGPRHTLTEGLRQAATTPPMIAAIAGLLVNLSGLTIPSVIITAVHSAGQVVAPLMLFSIGLALRAPNTRALYALAPSLIIKLVAAPLLGVALTALTLATAASDADADVLRAIRLESAMPTMVLTMVFAERYGLDEELLAQAILISTVLSMLTLPVVAGW